MQLILLNMSEPEDVATTLGSSCCDVLCVAGGAILIIRCRGVPEVCLGDALAAFSDGDDLTWVSPFQGPNFSSVRARTSAASSGSLTFHLRESMLRIVSVRRAHSQNSAISSRFFTPCVMSRLAFLSGRFSR